MWYNNNVTNQGVDMIRFDLYVGKVLYFSTMSAEKAFETFRQRIGSGQDVRMKFVRILEEAA
tara:strand:- start:1145 stop:1330 length:186 start_codon:yes stop_codon:yes gene_type:complete